MSREQKVQKNSKGPFLSVSEDPVAVPFLGGEAEHRCTVGVVDAIFPSGGCGM